ncbi:MAG TPA: hypothetical protein VJ521_08565, partial [Acidobacteriota bacterium]|nr:hypothetical protein [Acidobacteriota bacterium]
MIERALAFLRQKLAESASYRITLLLSLLLVLAVLFTYPLVLSPGDSLVSATGDTRLTIWMLCWPVHQLLNDPLELYHGNIFFPGRNTLAFADNMLSNSLLALPVFLISKNPTLTYNFLLLASILLAGLGMYLLAHRLTGSHYAALIAAVLYSFSATRMARISQIQLFTTHWTPFALLYLHRFLDTYSFRNLILFTFFFILQALAGAYNAVYLVSAVAIAIPFLVIVEGKYKDRELYGKLFLFGCLSAAALLPFFLPYLENAKAYGMVRHPWVISKFSPDLRAYLAIPTNFYLWLASRFGLHSYLFSEAPFLFPGLIPLILALAGVWRMKISAAQACYVILALFALIASAGSKLYLYDLLYEWFLLFKMTRVPSRFILLFVLCLSLLSAFGIRALLQQYQDTRRRVYIVVAVLLPLLFLAESYFGPLSLFKVQENKEVYHWLADENP